MKNANTTDTSAEAPKHTPGMPRWELQKDADEKTLWIVERASGQSADARPVCQLTPWASSLSNARLIAAAPELLETLKGFLEIQADDLTGEINSMEFFAMRDHARAAIARAEGRT